MSLWRDRGEGPSSFWDWDQVSRSSSWNCRPQLAKLAKQHDGWCNLWRKTRFMLNTCDICMTCKKTFLGEKCSNLNKCKLCVKLVMCRMRAIPMAPISITRACEAKWKSRKQKITCNGQFSTPLSCLSTVDGSFLKGLLHIINIGSADLSPVTMARESP